MRLAIMQPYFLPYIGYFQLIGAVDAFVVYDNIKYTKKGWINRNRLLSNATDGWFTLPLKKASDACTVIQRELAVEFEREKLLKQLKGAYLHAPFFHQAFPIIECIVNHGTDNLFDYIHYSLVTMCSHLGISTPLHISSSIDIDHNLKGQDKVLALCRALGANEYVNPIGGLTLYDRTEFQKSGVNLHFLQSQPCVYQQIGSTFVPWLSIVDVLMFNPLGDIRERLLNRYELV